MDIEERRRALTELNEKISRCNDCTLARHRTRAVPGEGRIDAEIMFIGEAPGYYEDQQGRPFIGAAGQFLDQLLASIEMKRSDVFIANIIKSRPPGNRDPLPAEIEACGKWLDQQLEIIQPKVVVTLGRYSLGRFLPGTPISKVHGQARKVGGVLVAPMYHPAAALHQGSLRQVIEADFRRLPGYVEQALRENERQNEKERQPPALAAVAAAPAPAQMKLF